mgnify:CR=1 FL=1
MRDRSILQSGIKETLARSPEHRRYSIFVGGFPCQDLSIAGRQAGLNGDRSGLYREYLTIINACKPDWVVTENVGHTWKRWVPELRRELFKLGYASLPLRVRALDVGAPHERKRIFIVAHADSELLWELSRWWSGKGREMAKKFTITWDKTPRRLGSNDGISFAMDRRRAIGNAIVPQIAEIIATGIKEVMK